MVDRLFKVGRIASALAAVVLVVVALWRHSAELLGWAALPGALVVFFQVAPEWIFSRSIEIVVPREGQAVLVDAKNWVDVTVEAEKARGIYWVGTHDRKGRFWPHGRVGDNPDGEWIGRANLGPDRTHRQHFIALMLVSEVVDQFFENYRDRGEESGFYGPYKLKLPEDDLKVVQSVAVSVRSPA